MFILDRLLVKKILENPLNYKWELQGFGMLRIYLDKETRLQVWSNKHQTKDVSIIHNHPWSFNSNIICGQMTNILYTEYELTENNNFYKSRILTGENAHQFNTKETTLIESHRQTYSPNTHYFHHKDIPHRTEFIDGTVTIIRREDRNEDSHADSYWELEKGKDNWVSAAPRLATEEEILDICEMALKLINLGIESDSNVKV